MTSFFFEYGPCTWQKSHSLHDSTEQVTKTEFSSFVGFCWFIGNLEEDKTEYGNIVYVDAIE